MNSLPLIWLPRWVSDEVRRGLVSEHGCRCTTFCNYYKGGGGSRPTVLNICPLYFRDRLLNFEAVSQPQAVDFLDRQYTSRNTLFVKFDDEKVSFEFCRGVLGSEYRLRENFKVYRDQRPVSYHRTSLPEPQQD